MTDPTVQICTLASGSGGNSVYLRFGEDEILIDAGISCRRITDGLKALGTSPENLRAVFEIESKITLSEEGVPYCIATGSARGKESI